ncbi:MAG: hypothetical protein JWM53_1886 [bacterium]|nr:hypothetical protein [bacterium]
MADKPEDAAKPKLISRGLVAEVLLYGSGQLFEAMFPKNEKRQMPEFSDDSAREVMVSRAALAMQRAGWTMRETIRMEDELAKLAADDPKRPIYLQQIGAQTDQQTVWVRKLGEALMLLIGFSTTNEERYYAHYLRINQILDLKFEQEEQETFFARPNIRRGRRIKELRRELEEFERRSRLQLGNCWYLGDRKQRQPSSALALMKFALGHATQRERIALGYTYEFAFAGPSEVLHFSPLAEGDDDEQKRFELLSSRMLMLAWALLKRSQELLGLAPTGGWCEVARTNEPSTGPGPLVGRAKIGDVVYEEIDGQLYLGIVTEVRPGDFGYEGYRVKYLDDQPDSVAEDWVVKRLGVFLDKASTVETMQRQHPDLFEQFTHELIDESRVEAAVQMWRLGLRKRLEADLRELRERKRIV